MTVKWLAHALGTWLDKQGQAENSYNPDQLYLVSQQTVEQSEQDATHDVLLDNAKRNWAEMNGLSENETAGRIFRDWLQQHGQSLEDHPRFIYIISAVLEDVRRAIPNASPSERLQAIKGLWNAHIKRLNTSQEKES